MFSALDVLLFFQEREKHLFILTVKQEIEVTRCRLQFCNIFNLYQGNF